jgi:hypothetical protein
MKAVLMFVALSGFGIGGLVAADASGTRSWECVSRQSFWLDGLVGIGRFLAPSSFSSFQS